MRLLTSLGEALVGYLRPFPNALGHLAVDPSLRALAALLLSPAFVVIWCGGLTVYFAYELLRLLAKSLPLQRSLAEARQPLQGYQDPKSFAEHFEEYRNHLRKIPLLSGVWHEFEETLITRPAALAASGSSEQQAIRNTIQPSAYLTDSSVIAPNLPLRWFQAVPGRLTGAGILGTFLGLAAGVGLAAADLASQDPAQVRDALQNLLQGASLAFITSIAGISTSLLFLAAERSVLTRLRRTLDAWVMDLERCLELLTPEEIALRQLDQNRRQTAALETLANDLVLAMESALENKVVPNLSPPLTQILQALEALRADYRSHTSRALEQLSSRFQETLHSQTQVHFDALSSTLSNLDESLNRILTEFSRSQDTLLNSITAARDAFVETLEVASQHAERGLVHTTQTAAESLAQATASSAQTLETAAHDAAAELRNLATPLTDAASALLRQTEISARLSSSLNETFESLEKLRDGLASATGELVATVAPLTDLRHTLHEASRVIADRGEAIAATSEAMLRLHHTFSTTTQHLTELWERHEKRFDGVDRSLRLVFEQFDQALERYTEQITRFVTELDRLCAEAARELTAAVGEVHELVEDLAEARRAGD